jgi:phosphocarrier protein FPr/phosphocarrier protein
MIEILSPVGGWVMPLDSVPDPVFAERMLGEGVAVDPIEGRLVAPAAATVESVHAAGHAVTLNLDSGPVVLIHIGLDTVGLGGSGFVPQVKAGDHVEAGETLILFDLDEIVRKAPSLVTPMIVTNGDRFRIVSTAPEGQTSAGAVLLSLEHISAPSVEVASLDATSSRTLRLSLAHGLHARPAARVSKLAREFEAETQIVTEDGRIASAESPVQMLGLGLSHGAMLTIQAGGPEAEQAVAALVSLLETGMGELQAVGASPAATAADAPSELKGVVAVPGLAIGPAWLLENSRPEVAETGGDMQAELKQLERARSQVESALENQAAGENAAAAIAEAQLAMLRDPLLASTAKALIAQGKSAGFGWRQALEQFAVPLRASPDKRFAERLDDLADLERRVLGEIAGSSDERPALSPGSIVIAETIYPSQVSELAEAGAAGIATAAGGATSHAAIIAAGLGLPMTVGLGHSLTAIPPGSTLILRGDTLSVGPAQSVLEAARREAEVQSKRTAARREHAHVLATTSDGSRIEVFANLGTVADATAAVDQGAEGCGLLRTEFLFLDRSSPPSEDEQRTAYQEIADALGDRTLIVRTLDIGADKPAPWLPLAEEDNPALGLRGIRLQLARRELLETQLRALLSVKSVGNLQIMVPMVSTVSELTETRSVLDRLATEMRVVAPDLGIMVETPAAALMAGALARHAAFFSIGSNDLSQYTLARDRTNPAVADGLDGLDPAVLRLMDSTVRGGAAHRRVTGVCGGLAAVPEATPILLGLGVTELSVPAAAVPEVKALVRTLDLKACRAVAAKALEAPDAAAVRALVMPILEKAA